MDRANRELHLETAQRLHKAGNWLMVIAGVSLIEAGREFMDNSKVIGGIALGVGVVAGLLARQSYFQSETMTLRAYGIEHVPPQLEVIVGGGEPTDTPPAELHLVEDTTSPPTLRIVDEPA